MSESKINTENFSPLKSALIAVEGLQRKIKNLEATNSEPIAIIGMGCKFPKAESCSDFWSLLINGENAIEEVPKNRWDIEEFYNSDFTVPGKMTTRWGGFLKDVDKFDPTFFGISPREAINMDPQQRILLEVTWQAFENAGIIPSEVVGSKTGVFVGIGNDDYSQFTYGNYENLSSYTGTGNAPCIAANRISFLLDFIGPSLAIDTACSSSLVAIHLAVKSLRSGESNMAVAAGINIILSPDVNITFSKAQMMASDGKCKTFDSKADGYVRSEGAGVIILKRLSDAQKDGDNIISVIKGTASNQDGKSNGITAPNSAAQVKVINAALDDANIKSEEICYLEAHGTGTSLGDPIETNALAEVFKTKPINDPIILGAVKTNIGHLEAAAGMAGVIKAVLSIKKQIIPKNIHFEKINPLIPIDRLPFKIPTENEEFKINSKTRIVGVSSFGFGGTNAHVIIEEPPIIEHSQGVETIRPNHILTISSKTEEGVKTYVDNHIEFLTNNNSNSIADYCYSNNNSKSNFEYRVSIIAKTNDELIEKLTKIKNEESAQNLFVGETEDKKLSTAFLFTGQGAQYVAMAKELYNTQPKFKKEFDKCSIILNKYLATPLIDVVFPKDDISNAIDNTAYTQPALFAIEYSLAKLWQSWGVQPNYLIGHSVGEYPAAVIAEVFSLEDGLKLIAARGRLMQSLPQDGEMAVIFTTENVAEIVERVKDKVSIAGLNGPTNTVISGETKSVQEITQYFEEKKIKTQNLNVSHAFHSSLMEPILDEFEKIAKTIKYNKPKIPIVSNLTGELLSGENIPDAEYWTKHIRNAVQFMKGMKTLDGLGVDIFLEVGPHPVLMRMGRNCLPRSNALWVSSLQRDKNDWQIMLNSLSQLYVNGYKIDWKGFDKPYNRKQVFIPTYPFLKERYWVDGSIQNVNETTLSNISNGTIVHPLMHRRLYSPLIKDIVYETQLSAKSLKIIDDHRIFGIALLPATGYAELAIVGANNSFGKEEYELNNLIILEGIVFKEVKKTLIQIIFSKLKDNSSEFQIFSTQLDSENNDSDGIEWTLNATGVITRIADEDTKKYSNVELKVIQNRCEKSAIDEVANFYDSIREYGFEHGKTMRLIRDIWSKEGEALGWFTLDEKSLNEVDEYLIHPAITDAGTQLIAAALSTKSDVIKKAGIYLPVGMESFRIFKTGVSKVWGHVILTDANADSKQLKSILKLYDVEGQIVAEILGLTLSLTSRETLVKLFLQDPEQWIYKTIWEKKPVTESENIGLNGKWLIFGKNSKLSTDICNFINEKKGEPILVLAGDKYKEVDSNTIQITLHSSEHIKQLLNYVNNGNKNIIHGIIYLWNLDSTANDKTTLTELNQIHKNVINQVLLLIQNVTLEGWLNSPKIWLFSRNIQQVNDLTKEFNIANAPLLGLGNVIELEHPELNCVRVDLENDYDEKNNKNILSEILSTDEETQIAYRDGERFAAKLVKVNDEKETDEDSILISKRPKRLEIEEKGVLDNLMIVPLIREKPSANTVEIRVHATGLNFRDVLNALDLYPGDPGLLGGECSGVIAEIGEGVTEFEVGDEVLAVASGSFGTHVLTYANLVVHKPKNISFEEASTIPIAFLTAYYTLHKLANISKGDKVLIHAASGGVGLAAIQIAKMYGATVFGTAGNDEKRAVIKNEGAELVMDSRSLDFADEIMKHTNNEGVNILLNSFNGKAIEKGMSIMAKNGHFLEIGKIGIWDEKKVGEYREDIKYNTIAIDSYSENEPSKIKSMLVELMEKFEEGELTPIRHSVYSLEDSISAFKIMRKTLHIGKVVVNQQVEDVVPDERKRINIIQDGTYLITGGRGGLGLLVAKWLVNKGAKNLILSGRSEPTDEVKKEIARFEKAGVKVKIPQVDISDKIETEKMLKGIVSNKPSSSGFMPKLKGVIHAAGILDDGILIQQNWERFEKVMKSKIDGAWNLHQITKDHALDFMIFFSSASSLIGSPGQGNYASANSFMDVLAHYRRSKDLPTLSINWGPWSRAGMAVTTGVKKINLGNGMESILPFQGIELLDKLLHETHEAQVGVMPINWRKFIEQFEGRKIPSFFEKLLTENLKLKKENKKTPELIKKLDETEQSEHLEITINFLIQKVVSVLGLSENHKISITKPLSEMGLDSLMGFELKKAIDQGVGENLPVTMVFNYPTIEALGGYLLDEVLCYGECEEYVEQEEEGTLQNIEELTEEEAEELLLKKLGLDE